MHLASVHTRSRRGIVPIIAPRGMVEVNYKITAIRDDGIVESQSADATPIANASGLPLNVLSHAPRLPRFGHIRRRLFRYRIASVGILFVRLFWLHRRNDPIVRAIDQIVQIAGRDGPEYG